MNIRQDKVLDHTREQLSALFDNELALDEARFLERRLQHDAALASCVSRWQVIGDAMRGQASAPAPAGFSDRVALAVAAEAVPVAAARHEGRLRRAWMPGAALAASVALVALFATRQVDAPDGQAPAAQVAQAAVPDGAGFDGLATPAPATPAQLPQPPVPQAPTPAAAQLAAAVAVAEVPRRVATRRASAASRGQSQRAATTRAARAADDAQPQFAVASAAPSNVGALQSAVAAQSPFAPAEAAERAVVARPWPRALLPNAAAGTFNVGYGSLQPAHPQDATVTFHPFRPRVVAPPENSTR